MSPRVLRTSHLPGFDRVLVWFNDPSNWEGPNGLTARLAQHLMLTGVTVAAAALIAIPLGVLVGHTGRGARLVSAVTNVLRAVPALGLLILFIVALSPHIHIRAGVTSAAPPGSVPYLVPVLLVLLVLAVPAILTATYTGMEAVDPALRDAARGSGLSHSQMILDVELPCATPAILSGVRSSTLQVVASLTVAAYAPLVGGLGRLIVDGTQNITDPQYGYPAMVAAAIAVACLAVVVDLGLGLLARHLTPKGLRPRRASRGGTPSSRPPHRARAEG